MTTVWVNGELRDAADARVSATDHGLTVGDGVFETCQVRDGAAVALTRHLRRMARSADVLGLRLPPEELLREAVRETLAAAGPMLLGRLRITLTGGAGPLGSDRGDAAPTLLVAVTAAAPWPAVTRVVTVPWTRNERSAIAGAKTTSYAENVVALAEARRRGAQEALFANTRGELCEGTGTNVVVVLDGALVTPPLSSGCLAGITRELLLEWGAGEGLPVVEKELPLSVLAEAEDVLLTSSTRGVQPQAEVDGRPLRNGDVARAAAAVFERRLADDLDP